MTLLKRTRLFWLILISAFLLRLGVAFLAPHPGISDSNHYYNLARNVAQGRGFVIDYIWNYYNHPTDVTHPEDYWMPLPAVYPAVMLRLFPDNLFMALLPSVLFGTAVVVLAYAISAIGGLPEGARLLAMGMSAFMPELVLNSARTDTTISYVFYIGLVAICFYQGLSGKPRWLVGAGIFAGCAHLTRQDTILLVPALVVTLGIFWRFGTRPLPWRWLWVMPLAWVVVMSPWFYRNYTLFGAILSSGSSRTIFMTSFIDQFTYGRDLNLQHWWAWGVGNIVGNIVFQTLANVRMMLTLPDVFVPVVSLLGLGVIAYRRAREKALFMALPMVLVLGLFMFYSVITPFHTQGGSFKKSFMLFLPFLSYAGAYAVWEFVRPQRVVVAIGAVVAVLMAMNAVQLVREDFAIAKRFNQSVIDLSVRLHALGDVNGDGEIIVMTQDPFILNYHGFRAIIMPSDPRDMILEAAYTYHVDYIILPAAREGLDALYNKKETDVRLDWLEGTNSYQLLRVRQP